MFIDVNGCKLFFDVYGSKLHLVEGGVIEKPTLIVLHGGHGFADHTLYVEFWSQFADMAQVVFLDQRGCGRSDLRSSYEWNLKQWGRDVFDFCAQLGIKKPILAGISMGGHVIGECIKNCNDLLGGAIFCNTEAHFSANDVASQFEKHGYLDAAKACIALYATPSNETFADYAKYCLPLYAKNAYSTEEKKRCIGHKEVFLHFIKNEANTFDYRDDLRNVTYPTLIMAGERGSHTAEAAYEMSRFIPSKWCDYHLFQDAGAPVYKDEPGMSYNVVKEFLTKFTIE